MKRSAVVLFILILILLILPSIYAVEFSMGENFMQGETIITKVSGNFITPITRDNIFFYRGHVSSPMQYDVSKIGDDYYIYALTAGKNSGDYFLSIQNVQYMKGTQISDEKIIKNFSITNETADFLVKPGFIVSENNFYLEIQNLKDNSIDVNIKTETGKRDIFILPEKNKEFLVSLNPGELKKINFELGAGGQTFQTIELSSSNGTFYEIPVYIFSVLEGQEKTFRFESSELIFSILTNTRTKKTIILQNTGDNDLENISLSLPDSLKPYANLSVNKIETLGSNSDFSIELSLFSLLEKDVEGTLKAETENDTAKLFISLNFISNYTNKTSSTKTCAELNGTLFNTETEKCDGEYENVKDGWCCFGTISPIEKNSSQKIIAAIIVILITIVLIWFYFAKYRRTKKKVDLLKIAKGKK
jgi:hypothetical protein